MAAKIRAKQEESKLERAVLFQRVSSGQQDTSAKFTRTRKDAEAYADGGHTNMTRKRYALEKTKYRLVGSAFSKDIRESEEMLSITNKVDSGEWETPLHMFVACLDRIDRREMEEALTSFLNLMRKGIIIHELSTGVVVGSGTHGARFESSEANKLINALEVSFMESERKSRRAYAYHKQYREEVLSGERKFLTGGGNLPKWFSGYDKETHTFIQDKEEVKKLKFIFRKLEEGISGRKVAIELNEKGKRNNAWYFKKVKQSAPEKEKGQVYRLWRATDIKKVYRNDSVIGVLWFKKKGKDGYNVKREEKKEDYYPAIISNEQFYNVQKQVSSRKQTGKETHAPSILNGVCRCGYCSNVDGQLVLATRGMTYIGTGAEREPIHFRKCQASNMAKGHCTYSRIRENEIETQLFRFIREVDLTRILRPETGSKAKLLREQLRDIEGEVAEYETAIKSAEELLDKRLAKGQDPGIYEGTIDRTKPKLEAALEELNKLKDSLSEITSEAMTKFDKKKLLKLGERLEEEAVREQINLELKRVLDHIDIYPLGLPKKDLFRVRNMGYGQKKNRRDLYGNNLPAFRLVFKNGVTRTIMFSRVEPENAICIFEEEGNYLMESSFAAGQGSPVILGNREFAEKHYEITWAKSNEAEELRSKELGWHKGGLWQDTTKQEYLARSVFAKVCLWRGYGYKRFQNESRKLFPK